MRRELPSPRSPLRGDARNRRPSRTWAFAAVVLFLTACESNAQPTESSCALVGCAPRDPGGACHAMCGCCGSDDAQTTTSVPCVGPGGGTLVVQKTISLAPTLDGATSRVVGAEADADAVHVLALVANPNDPCKDSVVHALFARADGNAPLDSETLTRTSCGSVSGMTSDAGHILSLSSVGAERSVLRLGVGDASAEALFTVGKTFNALALSSNRLWLSGAGLESRAYPSGDDVQASSIVYSGGPTVGLAIINDDLWFSRDPFEGGMENYLLLASVAKDEIVCEFHTELLSALRSDQVTAVAAYDSDVWLSARGASGQRLIELHYERP